MPIEGRSAEILHREIVKHVAPGIKVYTDEHKGYNGLEAAYEHGRPCGPFSSAACYGTWRRSRMTNRTH